MAIMAMASVAMADKVKSINPVAAKSMPSGIAEKIAAIKAGVESKVEAKSEKTNKARVKDGDWILLHDGSTVKVFRQIDPLEEMSFPNTLTCFIGTKDKCEKEIEKLNK
jgi:ASC-1-like (ASCH) protein